jgi:hypothetical protein
MRSSIFSHGGKILPGTSFTEIRLETFDVGETAESVLLARASVSAPLLSSMARFAEIILHTSGQARRNHLLLSLILLYDYV